MTSPSKYLTTTPPANFAVKVGEINKLFLEYLVITNTKTIETAIESLSKNSKFKNNSIINSIYFQLCKYNPKVLNSIYIRKNKQWDDWCNDAVLFFACRFVMDGIPIPVIDISKLTSDMEEQGISLPSDLPCS